MHKPENERIHHNGEDYVPAFWLQSGLDAIDRCCGELETAEKRIAALEEAARVCIDGDNRDDPLAVERGIDMLRSIIGA